MRAIAINSVCKHIRKAHASCVQALRRAGCKSNAMRGNSAGCKLSQQPLRCDGGAGLQEPQHNSRVLSQDLRPYIGRSGSNLINFVEVGNYSVVFIWQTMQMSGRTPMLKKVGAATCANGSACRRRQIRNDSLGRVVRPQCTLECAFCSIIVCNCAQAVSWREAPSKMIHQLLRSMGQIARAALVTALLRVPVSCSP